MLFSLLFFFFLLAGAPVGASLPTPGDIIIGQSSAQTGFFAAYGAAIKAGILACFEQINAQGGIHGKKIRLIDLDDRGDAVQTTKNIMALHRKHHITLFLGIMGTKGIGQALDIFTKKQALALFPWGDSEAFASTPYIIPGFPSVQDQINALLSYCVTKLGIDSLGLFYGDDQFSTKAALYAQQAAPKQQVTIRGTSPYNRLTLAIANSVSPLIEQNPKAVLCLATSAPTAYAIDHFLGQGHFGTNFLSIDSGLFVPQLLAQRGITIHLASLVPPFATSKTKTCSEYLEAMRLYCPQQQPTILSFAYYLASRLVVNALQTTKDPTNLADFYDTLTKNTSQTLADVPIAYNAATKRFWHQVWVVPVKGEVRS